MIATPADRRRLRGPSTALVALLFLAPALVLPATVVSLADGGSHGGSGGGGSGGGGGGSGGGGHGNSGGGGSGGHGSDDGGSGGSSHSGSGRSDGSDDDGKNGDRGKSPSASGRSSRGETRLERRYFAGWRERIRGGRYELFDPKGRPVIRRTASPEDYSRFAK